MKTITLTAKQEAFCTAMADPSCASPMEAYRRSYDAGKSTDASVTSAASKLLADDRIRTRLAELRNAAGAIAMIDAAGVLREWLMIATADPSELVRSRRFCCRHCYGFDHRYQWISEEEFALACARVIDHNVGKTKGVPAKAMPAFDGGVGYVRTNVPVATCPHCGGDGYVDTYIEDTHRVSPAARRLFAGVKETANGIEIKFRDQDAALANLAKYLGMLVDRTALGGDPLNPTPIGSVTVNMTPAEAAKLYAVAMGASK